MLFELENSGRQEANMCMMLMCNVRFWLLYNTHTQRPASQPVSHAYNAYDVLTITYNRMITQASERSRVEHWIKPKSWAVCIWLALCACSCSLPVPVRTNAHTPHRSGTTDYHTSVRRYLSRLLVPAGIHLGTNWQCLGLEGSLALVYALVRAPSNQKALMHTQRTH